jgi:MFS family permease
MEPSGVFAAALGLPKLVGPYFIAAFTLALSVIVIQLFLKPDPFLTANKAVEGAATKPHESMRSALKHIREYPIALFAIASVAIGHLAMVSIMVMTPVHMAHSDASLRIIGLVISVHVLGMYAFSPIVGAMSDKFGRIKTIQIGIFILIASALISALAPHHDSFTLGIGLFLLGLGWSFTLIAGSTLLSETVSVEMRPSTQGASDLVMNLMGAGGAAIGGVIIGFFSYAALCYATGLVVVALGIWSLKLKTDSN